jgi:hypothetical protein
MVLLGDEALVDAHFSPFRDSANLDARLVHGLRRRTIGSKIILDTRWNSLMTWVMWKLDSVRLEPVLVSVQDRCTVYAPTNHRLRNHLRCTRWLS